jgi:hypothetical protein
MGKRPIVALGVLIAGALFLILARGALMKALATESYYHGEGVVFAYPKDWTLRRSQGTQEKYSQVHIFKVASKKAGFGPSITVTVYPASSLKELEDKDAAGFARFKDFSSEAAKTTKVAAVDARDVTWSYSLRMPLYDVNSRELPIKERSLYLENGSLLFVLSYKNLKNDYSLEERVFKRLLKTFRFAR